MSAIATTLASTSKRSYRPTLEFRRRRSVEEVIEGIDVDTFDWAAYEGSYKGRALITRLTHIPKLLLSRTSNPTPRSINLARSALHRLIPIIKAQTWDHELYLWCLSKLDDCAHPEQIYAESTSDKVQSGAGAGSGEDSADAEERDGQSHGHSMYVDKAAFRTNAGASGSTGTGSDGPDYAWVVDAKERAKIEHDRLDVELKGYMSNLIKESIRLTFLAFAQLSVKVGSSQSAMKNFAAVREYSTSPQHHVDLGVAIVETMLSFNLPTTLLGNVTKLEATLDRLHPPVVTGQGAARASAADASVTAADLRERREQEARSLALRRNVTLRARVAKGLVALTNGEWARAGRELGNGAEDGGLGDWEGKAISSADLALITAFCTLASSDRDRIRRVLLDHPSFRAQVDDGEVWLLDLIRAYVDAKYGEVMVLLQRAEPKLLLNPFLSLHSHALINLIRTRAVVQYVQPFSSVQINAMAQAFGLPNEEMLALVEVSVMDGDIKGQIDLIDKVLILDAPDERKDMFVNALRVGRRTTELTQNAVFRMKLTEAGIIVDPRPQKGQESILVGAGGGGSWSGETGQSIVEDEGLGELDGPAEGPQSVATTEQPVPEGLSQGQDVGNAPLVTVGSSPSIPGVVGSTAPAVELDGAGIEAGSEAPAVTETETKIENV